MFSFGRSGKQLTHRGFLFDIRQDQDAFSRDQPIESGHGLFEQRFFRDQTKELFRTSAAAQRPEAFTTPSREDERIDRIGHDGWSETVADFPITRVARFPFPFSKREV